MFFLNNGKVTTANVLLAVGMIGFVLFLTLAFQFSQVLQARSDMHSAIAGQDKQLEGVSHIREQFNALAVGTLKLSRKGDKGAGEIIDRLKQMGIDVHMPSEAPMGAAAPMGAPAGMGVPQRLTPP
ncbi:MAG TPA: hypothetical protein VMV79_03225 [Alphaproteobacteria bacterium]|nr:hypothetical protein [Alphaproteobacteria bacterium]